MTVVPFVAKPKPPETFPEHVLATLRSDKVGARYATNDKGAHYMPPQDTVSQHLAEILEPWVRWVPEMKQFAYREGRTRTWCADSAANVVVRHVVAMAVRYLAGALRLAVAAREDMLKRNFASAVLANLRDSTPELVRPLSQWDAVPHDLQTPSCVVDLRTSTVRPTGPKDFNLRKTAVDPDPVGPVDLYEDKLLAGLFEHHDAERTFFQDLMGSTMFGDNRDQVLPWLLGDINLGKGTLIGVSVAILGSYAAIGDSNLIVRPPGQNQLGARGEGFELATYQGRRLIANDEVEERNGSLATALIKRVVSNGSVKAAFKGRDGFDLPITWTIWMRSNNLPRWGLGVEDTSGGVSRRLKAVSVHGARRKAEPDLLKRVVEAEGGAVLWLHIQWALARWQRGEMLPEPASARGPLSETGGGMTPETWFQDVTEVKWTGDLTRDRVFTRDLWGAYDAWCTRKGQHAPITEFDFWRRIHTEIVVRQAGGKKGVHAEDLMINGVRAAGYRGVVLAPPKGDENLF